MNDQLTRDDHAYEVLVYQRELDKIEKVIDTNNMLLNSNGKNNSGNVNSSQQPLLMNTSSFNSENLENCISISRDIARREQWQQFHRRFSHPTPLEATLTYEEIFESSLADHRYEAIEEYQNMAGPRQITDLDVSQSIKGCMKYFDEDVNVDSGPSRSATPNKLASGTVAAAVANIQTNMSQVVGSPPPPYKEHATPKIVRHTQERTEPTPQMGTIQKLRKKYEQHIANEPKPPKVKQLPRPAPAVPSPTLPKRPKSPKASHKSKVRQMAHMFNNKIQQLMGRDSTHQKGSKPLDVTQTQISKPAKKPGVLKPAPKARHLPTFRTGLPSPVPSPRFKHKTGHPASGQPAFGQAQSETKSACLVAEDVFRKLSVKDKALLYSKFIEDMSKRHPQFSIHARIVEATVRQEVERIEGKQKPRKVKELARELEAKFFSPKPKISSLTLKRLAELQKTPEYEAAAAKMEFPLAPPPPAIAAALQSLQEQDDEHEEAKQAEGEVGNEEVEAEELHVSTLTVVMKPSPDKRAPKQREVPHKARELQFIHDMRQIERSQKRRCEAMRSSVSFDFYGPPKKIRRTEVERMQPKAIFKNSCMERLFYKWIMEKNGVTFKITPLQNSEDSLCANADETNTSKSSNKSKSKVYIILEKAKAKLDSVEARVMGRSSNVAKKTDKAMKVIKEATEKKVHKSVIEVDLSNSKTGSDEDHAEYAKNLPIKVKRQAPPPPKTQKSNSEQGNQQESSSLTSSHKQSGAESESGLSSRRKVKRQAPPPPKTQNSNSEQGNGQESSSLTFLPHKQSGAESESGLSSRRKVKRQAPPPPPPKTQNSNSEQGNQQESSSLTSSDKQSGAESESGLSSLPKITSDESQKDQNAPPADAHKTAESEVIKPIKPIRKKKMRRTLTWKKENCIVECRPMPSSTESEGEHANAEEKEEEVVSENVMESPQQAEAKLDITQVTEMAAAAKKALNKEQQQKKEIINKARIINSLNIPQKIKSAYTLSIVSTASENTESDPENKQKQQEQSTGQLPPSTPTPTLVSQKVEKSRTPEKTENIKNTNNAINSKTITNSTTQKAESEETLQKLIDSFVDLGFETGSNGMESPVRRSTPVPKPRSKGASPLFIKLTPEQEKALQQNRSSFSSTPVKGMTTNQSYQVFSSNAARQIQQECNSTIGTVGAGRRRSLIPISEDHPLEHIERSQTQTPLSPINMETSFFGNSFNLNVSHNSNQSERPSKFWIRADDFTINLDVFYLPPNRLRLLYDIFNQKSCETRDLHFGIDDYKFSTKKLGDKANISNGLPTINGCSHYWFSTGDLAMPFTGKYLAPEKIERMFAFIKDIISEKTQLRCGVDDYEFSRVSKSLDNSAKFSMESNYGMLVNLQGTSNEVEGRSRCGWPSTVYNSANSNGSSIKTSDFDSAEMCSEFDNSELRYLTQSPTGTNYVDAASVNNATPRNTNEVKCENLFDIKFDFETLDKLFVEDESLDNSMEPNYKESVAKMLHILKEQKLQLEELEQRMKTYSQHSGIAGALIPHSKESPLYMQRLRLIISIIERIGNKIGYKACTTTQLESFLLFLIRYVDICLNSCNNHMSKVLNALLTQQRQEQQELIKINKTLGVA